MIIFTPHFLEVRDIRSGRAVQLIEGADLRCTWDGWNVSLPPMTTRLDGRDSEPSGGVLIHGVRRNPIQLNPKVVVLQVFELVLSDRGEATLADHESRVPSSRQSAASRDA